MTDLNIVSPLPGLMAKRSSLERQLRQVNRDIEFLERKQALKEFVEADRINSSRTDIPALAEVVEWDIRFREKYRAQHQARNEAFERATRDESDYRATAAQPEAEVFTGNAKEVEAHVEGELEAAESLVTMDVESLSRLRAAGFDAAADLVGIREPRLSLLHCPQDANNDPISWWVGAYQRIGLL